MAAMTDEETWDFLMAVNLKSVFLMSKAALGHMVPRRAGVIVNAASIDPLSNQRDYDELLVAIRRMTRGRLYYNPLRSRAI